LRALPAQLIVVTHDLKLLDDFDRVLLLDEGQLVFDGPPAQAVARYVAACA
jgi:biotin transport system ATP-binding protein